MTNQSKALDKRCVDTIRLLAVDAIQKAKSGHPGMPMGAAPAGYVLFDRFLIFNPKNPKWFNRDRFMLSAGHGSMLQYALMHLVGYDSVTMDDIKNFRQWGSRTPGHPENAVTPGVEVTTGPLGQGIANAVGMAMAEKHLAARFNKSDCKIVDHHIYTLMGDGCQMEGIASEACSLAGHLGLGNLIALYDDNSITIDGPTDLAFSEDVPRRFEAYGWHVLTVENGDGDLDGLAAAIEAAKAETGRPTLISVKTTIGFGSPNKAGSADTHGAPLGDDEIAATRKALGYTEEPFTVAGDVKAHMAKAVERGAAAEKAWQELLVTYKAKYPEDAAAFEQLVSGELTTGWESTLPSFTPQDKATATRGLSGKCLNALADKLPGLIGGSADLAPSNKTELKDKGVIRRDDFGGRNIHFGVREHAMAAICTGMALHGSGLIPYCGTFLAFADYMRAGIRVASLSEAGVIFVMTHDSVAVGEDGPTHQPVEHIASLRAIPELSLIRPADGNETSGAYAAAIANRSGPTLLALSRQNVPHLEGTSAAQVRKGAYIHSDCEGTPELILIGSGPELGLCAEAAVALRGEGKKVRVVSMPSFDLFESQSAQYRESVLPRAVTKRLAVEAGTSFGWERYVGLEGRTVSIDRFGASAPGGTCLAKFGYTTENVLENARALLG